MIKNLRIRNFQKHKKLDIELDPNITCIVGATDTGKSSIIRAIKWVCTNHPSPDQFIRNGTEFVSVQLDIDENTVKRKKTKKENSYVVNGDKEFKAIRTDVPEEISSLLNISSVNFQSQHDSPFWLSNSPGEVSRQLNNVINLDRIDNLMSEASSRVRKKKIELQLVEERITEKRKQIQKYSKIDDLNSALLQIEEREIQNKILNEKTELLEKLINNYLNLSGNLKRIKSLENTSGILLKKVDSFLTDNDKNSALASLIKNSQQARHDADFQIPSIKKIDLLMTEYLTLNGKIKSINSLVTSYTDGLEDKEILQKEFHKSEIEFQKLSKEKCPLCGK
jgi:DNA repair exonuclease SbcCD ATPase subunit